MNNQECKIRPQMININSSKPSFLPNSVKINKCSGGCNNTNDPYAKLYVPDIIENIKVKL